MSAEATTEEIEHHDHPPYGKIFLWLVALTAVEVVLPFVLARNIAWIPMTFIAVWKIILIGGYFMHLKFDQKILMLIACAPILFAGFLTAGLLHDYVNMP